MAAPFLLLKPPFTPRKLPGLRLWLSADRIAGLADGDPITTWSDLSGQSNHATQGTTAAKPLYKVAIANGRPGILFDGVDDTLALATGFRSAIMAGDRTIFLVTKWVSHSANARALAIANAGGGTRCAISSDSGGLGAQWSFGYSTGAGAGTISAAVGAVPSANTTQISEATQSGTAYSGKTNGTTVGTAANAGVEAYGAGALGSNAAGTATFANIYILEVIAYNRALSASEASAVRRYLGARYGVTVS